MAPGVNSNEQLLQDKNVNDVSGFLANWRAGDNSYELTQFARTFHEEVLLSMMVGLLAMLAEYFVAVTLVDVREESSWLIAIPISFFVFTALIRSHENKVLQLVIPSDINRERAYSDGGSPQRLFRIVLNGGFLLLLLGLKVPFWLLYRYSGEGIDWTAAVEGSAYYYILAALNVAKYFQGSCVMVTLYRIYIDLAIQASSYLFNYPPMEPEEEPAKDDEVIAIAEADANANVIKPKSKKSRTRRRNKDKTGRRESDSDNNNNNSIATPTESESSQ